MFVHVLLVNFLHNELGYTFVFFIPLNYGISDHLGMNVAVELAPVLSSPESGSSSNPGSKRPAVGGNLVSKRLKMSDL